MERLTAEQIKKLIDIHSNDSALRRAKTGQKYYEGRHDILNYRLFYYNADGELVEDRTRSNERICHPFFTELVDQLTAYLLSNTENVITSADDVLQKNLELYFDEDFFSELSDLITGAQTKGYDYLYGFKNEENRLQFQYADCLGVTEVRQKDIDAVAECFIYSYIDRVDYGKKTIKRIQVHYADETEYFVQENNGALVKDPDIMINPCPSIIYSDNHGKKYGKSLGFLPLWRFDYNRKRIPALQPIKGLIDDYDLMECGLSNNLQDFDTPIHLVKGFQGSDLTELQQNLKTKKIIGVDSDGDLDIKTIEVPYEARKTKADEDEKNIYRFGMGLNTQGLKDTSATTNLAIQAAYTLLDLKATKVITRLKKFLKQIIKVVIAEINEQNGTGYSVKDVTVEFHPNILLNETENIQNEKVKAETKQLEINTVLNLLSQIGDEKALKAICDVMEWDYEELKDVTESPEQNLEQMYKTLEPEGDL